MAQRRMFSKEVTTSDLFVDMPSSSQLLYFHLGMEADDEGFIGNAKMLSRAYGSNNDDLKLLEAKGFIIAFPSGVTVVKDWNLNNKIRKDRQKPTIYAEEKALLSLDSKGSYLLGNQVPTILQPNVNQMSAQDRLGKDRLGKVRIVVSHSIEPIQTFYENNGFGTLSSKTIQDFNYWIDDFKKIGAGEQDAIDLIIHAMKLAVDNSVRKYSYVNSILKNWEQKRLITVEQVEVMEKEREQTKQRQQPHRASNMPDYSTWVKTGDDF